MPGQHGQVGDSAPDLSPETHHTGSSRPAWAAALLALGVLLSVVWLGWEGRTEPLEEAHLGSPAPAGNLEAAGTAGPISSVGTNDEGRCYCLAIPGPLQPRFEARLVRDGALLTSVGLAQADNDSLVGRITVSDWQAMAAVLHLTWNDAQQDRESRVLISLDLEQRYARRFVPRQFSGEFNLDAHLHGRTTWQYTIRRSKSEGGVVLSIEIEPLPTRFGSHG